MLEAVTHFLLSTLAAALCASAQVVPMTRIAAPMGGTGAFRAPGADPSVGVPILALSAPSLSPALTAAPAPAPAAAPLPASAAAPKNTGFSADDEIFLDELQHKAFLYFWEQSDPVTGLTKDRAGNFADGDRGIASMAATGFGLTALTIADKRGWITREQAYARALACLRHLRLRQAHEHGWFHHFVDAASGEPLGSSEVSSIDTALLLAGALTAGRHFAGTEVERLAQDIYERVDFPWMMTDGGAKPESRTLSMGWTERGGFLGARWEA